MLRAAHRCDTPTRIARDKTRRLKRNELARFYHHKTRKRLPRTRQNKNSSSDSKNSVRAEIKLPDFAVRVRSTKSETNSKHECKKTDKSAGF